MSVFALDHIALHRALEAQGYSRENLPYKIPGGQYAGPVSLFFHYYFYLQVDLLYLLKVNGNLPISLVPISLSHYFSGYTYLANFFKTKYVKPTEVKLKPLFYDVINRPEPPIKKLKGWEKISLLWG